MWRAARAVRRNVRRGLLKPSRWDMKMKLGLGCCGFAWQAEVRVGPKAWPQPSRWSGPRRMGKGYPVSGGN